MTGAPTNGPAPASIVAAVLREGDRVLLGHRSPQRRWYPDVWDLPGGHVEAGESGAQALVREVREELGVTIGPPTGPPLAVVRTPEFVMAVWLIENWVGTVRNTAPTEHDTLAWVDLDGLPGRAMAHPEYQALLTAALSGESRPARPRLPARASGSESLVRRG